MKKLDLDNKVVLLTGGEGIIGTSMVHGFINEGAYVCSIDIHEKSKIDIGIDAFSYYQCDLTDEKKLDSTVKQIVNDHKCIDILVNNAATKTDNLEHFFKDFENYDLETWKKVMDVNINSIFSLTKFVLPIMKKKNEGVIVNLSSIYGILGPDNSIYEGSKYLGSEINTPAVYSASKAAVIGFTKWLANYVSSSNIRVNCVAPGGIKSGQNNNFVERYSDRVPMERMANVEEVMQSIIFLASSKSSYINGHVLIVDGGLSSK